MVTVLSKSEQMLFALLRASLHQQTTEIEYFQDTTAEDWKQCYLLACSQGVMALAWDGIINLPYELQPPKGRKLTWAMAVEAYEKKYNRYCRIVGELSEYYRNQGITTVQLKGVGLSTYYPIPSHREGGDIDIFTFSADKESMSDGEANRLADELMKRQGIEVDMHSPKHSNFYYKGIPIENHKTFLNVERFPIAVQIEDILKTTINPQGTNLLNGECQILTPSPAFNTLFLAFHAAQHYGSGLALHHLCDWAILVSKYGVKLPEDLKDERFLEAIAALTRLCKCYLGTSFEMPGGETLADEMLEEILRPKYLQKGVTVKGKINIFLYKTRRFFYMSRLNNRILYLPLWKRVWESIVIHVRKPDTIFRVNQN